MNVTHAAITRHFFAWCLSTGAKLPKPLNISRRVNGLRGLFSLAHIERGELIAAVQQKQRLTMSTVSTFPVIPSHRALLEASKMAADPGIEALIPVMRMALFCCLEIGKDLQSPWEPWLSVLDEEDWDDDQIKREFFSLFDQWEQEHYSVLRTQFSTVITNICEYIESEHPDLPVTAALLRRIFRLVLARVVPTPDPRHHLVRRFYEIINPAKSREEVLHHVSMIPLIDLVNHSSTPNITVKETPEWIELRALSQISPGHELCAYYALPADKAASLCKYGFVPHISTGSTLVDSFDEYYTKGAKPNLTHKDPAIIEKERRLNEEVQRLLRVFKNQE